MSAKKRVFTNKKVNYLPRAVITILLIVFLYVSYIFIFHKPSLNLSMDGNLEEAAQNLFDFLRRLDKLSMNRIVVTPIPDQGLGKTINERLNRASL